MLCLTEAVLSQLLILKFCSMLIPSFVMSDELQPDNWHSIFQSAKVVLVTPSELLDIWRCEWDGFFRASQLNKKTQKKVIYSELLACFEPGLLQRMKPGSLMDWGQRTNPWNGSILILPGKKIEKVSVTGWGHNHSLLALWRCDSCDCDA
jgi:hypothetical protein